jgi:radical SAM protein with 4Fe4S-binding SPASM domain
MLFPSTPISFAVEITYACNNKCSGCANVWESQRREQLNNWKAIFDRICPPHHRQQYAELIRITGGEPTLHPEFSQIIQYIDSFEISHVTFTTGRWHHPHKLIELFKNSQNLEGLLISVHGADEFTHNSFVESVKRAFSETCKNIENATQAGIEVFTNTVLTKYNCAQIDKIIQLSKNLGASFAVFNRYLGKPHPLEPTEQQLYEAVKYIDELALKGEQCSIGNCIPKCFINHSFEGSNAGIEHCAISPQGFVRPDKTTYNIYGNVFENSIEEIWQSNAAQWYRQQILPACLNCVELPFCRGGAKLIENKTFIPDRFIKQPILEKAPYQINFPPNLKPFVQFKIREESFGYLLTRYNWSIPVSKDIESLLPYLNGETTLASISELFGESALNLIAIFHKNSMVEFKE